MTREIKFRAWDKEEKRMFNVIELGFNFNVERYNAIAYAELDGRWGKVMGRDRFTGEPIGQSWTGQKRENIELMQFTGLKDKNGKEIYLGDIVSVFPDSGAEMVKDSLKVVEYHAPMFVLKNTFHIFSSDYKYKVIGNIYENKELLNDK